MTLDPRASVIAHNAGRLLAALTARGEAISDHDILVAVRHAHEIQYQAELAIQRLAPVKDAA